MTIKKLQSLVSILILICFSTFLKAGEIAGKIQLKENKQLRTEKGQIFVGEIDHKTELNIKKFPSYLKAMVDSMKNRRLVPINKNGVFVIKNIPINKKLVIGVSLPGIAYYINASLDEQGSLKIEEIIDLELESKDLKVAVQNGTGIVFKADFASMSYLIQEGSKGRVFSGNKSKLGVISFGKVPLGLYKLYVLNKVNEEGPNRVDIMSIDLTKENKSSPLVFKIK